MSGPLLLVVFGGRDFADRQWLYAVLDRIHGERGIAVIIGGDEPGADMLAREWAESRVVPVERYPAAWSDLSPSSSAAAVATIMLELATTETSE